ncbi:hypothetical protein [Paenibacillus sp. GCM10027626]|uniref:hypothetical protein n=1 Tax=Paenibacillus sp. GCM10027626 TaxID=3273411 RepID=UPI003626B0A0
MANIDAILTFGYNTFQQLVIYDLEVDAPYVSYPLTVKIYEGHTAQLCTALSPDGTKLAYCMDPRQIIVVDLATGLLVAVRLRLASSRRRASRLGAKM